MIDSNMAVYILVCAVMLLAIVMLFFDNTKASSALLEANTRITELEMENRDIRIQRDLIRDERDGDYQRCVRLQEENDRLKSIRPMGESVLVPLENVTLRYDDYTLKVSFDIPDVIPGVNDEYAAELVSVLMSKEIAVRKAKEGEQ
jgi:hypothetical protein